MLTRVSDILNFSGSRELCSVQAAKSNRSWEGQGRKGAGLPCFAVFILLLEFLYFCTNPHAYFILLYVFLYFSSESIELPYEMYKKI